MKQTTIPVIFRKDKRDNEVVAFFPTMKSDPVSNALTGKRYSVVARLRNVLCVQSTCLRSMSIRLSLTVERLFQMMYLWPY